MLRAGLIGFPSSGKTTLFQLLTSARDQARPHQGKLDANVGVARVPDARLDWLTALYKPRRRVPATVEFADMAAGGRSTKDLVDVGPFRAADALVHVVRLFRDETVPLASGRIDAARDVQAIEDELLLADLGVVERRLERVAKDMKKGTSSELKQEQALLERCRTALEHATALRDLELSPEELKNLRGFQLLSAKPILLALNLDEADLAEATTSVERANLDRFLGRPTTRVVPVCAKIELEIAQLSEEDAAAFLTDLGLTGSGLDRVIRASYDLLGYISFFTVGEDECRAWSIPRGTAAQFAAGEIHSDIARGFIRAEVVAYDALVERGSMAACRDHGDLRLEGKEYVVQDGDIINFRFAT